MKIFILRRSIAQRRHAFDALMHLFACNLYHRCLPMTIKPSIWSPDAIRKKLRAPFTVGLIRIHQTRSSAKTIPKHIRWLFHGAKKPPDITRGKLAKQTALPYWRLNYSAWNRLKQEHQEHRTNSADIGPQSGAAAKHEHDSPIVSWLKDQTDSNNTITLIRIERNLENHEAQNPLCRHRASSGGGSKTRTWFSPCKLDKGSDSLKQHNYAHKTCRKPGKLWGTEPTLQTAEKSMRAIETKNSLIRLARNCGKSVSTEPTPHTSGLIRGRQQNTNI